MVRTLDWMLIGVLKDEWKWVPTASTKRRKSEDSAISPLAKKLSQQVSNTPSPKKTT